MGAAYIGLDVGGTFLKSALVNEDGRLLERGHEPIRKATADALLDQLASAADWLSRGTEVAGVGVGLPGIVDAVTGEVRGAPNVPVLDGLAVGQALARRTGRPTVAENDANAAALAESWVGAGRGGRLVFFVTLGTGIGGGIVWEGRVFTGTRGFAGEIGHVQVDPRGRPCGCGSWGCLETIAGSGGWVRRAEEALRTRDSTLRGRPLDPEVITHAARQGDAVALDVVDGAAAALGTGLGMALDLLNPDRVVVGGGVAAAGAFLLERIVAETRKRTFASVFAHCSFALAGLGGDAGVTGAARAAMLGRPA